MQEFKECSRCGEEIEGEVHFQFGNPVCQDCNLYYRELTSMVGEVTFEMYYETNYGMMH